MALCHHHTSPIPSGTLSRHIELNHNCLGTALNFSSPDLHFTARNQTHRASTAQHSSKQQVTLPLPFVTSDRCTAFDQAPTLRYVTLHHLYKVNTGTPRESTTLYPAITQPKTEKPYFTIAISRRRLTSPNLHATCEARYRNYYSVYNT